VTKLKVLDLFSGLGGFSLGLERTGGFVTTAFCEIDPFCRRVLAKHWPQVPCFDDVTTLRGEDVGPVDVICGGFPCQDISSAGLGEGLDGARSGLWSEFARLIGELRPGIALVENVAALLGRGLDRVLGDLASLGYDAEWHCIPASAVGAPHRRDRLWIVAYPQRDEQSRAEPRLWPSGRMGRFEQSVAWDRHWEDALSELRRLDDGLPRSLASTDAYRNAVVPQIPEIIGHAILKSLRAAA
jgi:DNA (cytosine-5)-methyltransferase 1